MTDMLAKVVIVVLALIAAGGAKYALQNYKSNKVEVIVAQEVEKVAEEVIKEETGFDIDKIDQSSDSKQS